MGIERCGKINAMNSGPDSCTGIGVVVRSFVILLIPEQLRQKHEQASTESPIIANNTRSYGNGETRNHLDQSGLRPPPTISRQNVTLPWHVLSPGRPLCASSTP